jgi:hypothetical protein
MSFKDLFRSHWFGFLLLMPFWVLLCVHDALDLSDDLFGRSVSSTKKEAMLFNLAMVGVFYLCIGAFVLHALLLADRGIRWVLLKVAFLAVYWPALLWLASYR